MIPYEGKYDVRGRLTILGAAALLLASAWPAQAVRSSSTDLTGRYIVVLKDGARVSPAAAAARATGLGGRVTHVYSHALNGFAASLPAAAVAALRADGNVAYVEADAPMRISVTQPGATWGIDRIDQRALPLSGTYTYNATGAGVTAYIIDTGIRLTHNEFGGRAVSGVDTIDGGSADDCHGHGTHVAGTVGGTTYGVAKGVRLVAVRVLNCTGSGSTSGVIAGVDWVTGNHPAGAPAVANMSLGGGASTSLDNAVKRSIADGVSYAIAAGNGDLLGFAQDACTVSPARVAEAMTISATDRTDTKPGWSNIGNCVDWFAPGVSITSAWSTSNTATNTISGTSMATPHTAGVAALYLQGNTGASPATVRSALFAGTTKGVVKNAGGGRLFGGGSTPNNHLLFTNY